MLLYAITILVSAFLLFQVQPVIAKIILPWFGGSAAVWTTCMLFFQLALLAGYLYAHALVRYVKPRIQGIVHAALLAASVIALPIYPDALWKPASPEAPILRILGLLAVSVGLPYFLLSTTGPLVQAWYARRRKGAMPYRLYALSNAGSMFALLSYPILFEPALPTGRQAILWSIAYGCFAVLCAVVALRSRNLPVAETEGEAEAAEKPGPGLYVLWTLLPACASALLLAITSHLTQNVASIPFLWVLPLSVYLLSFILCFESSGWYRRNPYLQLLAVSLGSMAYSMYADTTGNVPIKLAVPLFLLGLFACCMVCHGELARLKPPTRYLTHFYLMVSAGGALGGVLVGLAAPLLFDGYYELPIAIVACGALIVVVLRAYPDPHWLGAILPAPRFLPAAAAISLGGFFTYGSSEWITGPARSLAALFSKNWRAPGGFDQYVLLGALAAAGVFALILLRADSGLGWTRRAGAWGAFGIELIALMLAGYVSFETREVNSGYRVMARNFYGGLKVRDSGLPQDLGATRGLTHGTINHGEQYLHPLRRSLPTTYYGPNTGVGLAIRSKQQKGTIRVGVIGLGTGTLAAYGRPGDYYRFYEINPLVLRLARTDFSFLPDCKAKVQVAMGDARLSLEREQPENFDVLAVDAFSSDSIPVHLLTREAVQLYFRHLKPDGVLAVHISNRYLDLAPVVDGSRAALGKTARVVDTEDDPAYNVFGATWVLLTTPPAAFDASIMPVSEPLPNRRAFRPWTDDYSNLIQILK